MQHIRVYVLDMPRIRVYVLGIPPHARICIRYSSTYARICIRYASYTRICTDYIAASCTRTCKCNIGCCMHIYAYMHIHAYIILLRMMADEPQ